MQSNKKAAKLSKVIRQDAFHMLILPMFKLKAGYTVQFWAVLDKRVQNEEVSVILAKKKKRVVLSCTFSSELTSKHSLEQNSEKMIISQS